jgi:SPX domain protein involved in polyphosphate accumulation
VLLQKRHEIKYLLNGNSSQVINQLKNSNIKIRELFKPRKINTIYYLSDHFSLINEQIDFSEMNIKYRRRWYGDTAVANLIHSSSLEIKKNFHDITEKLSWPSTTTFSLRNVRPTKFMYNELSHLALTPYFLTQYRREYYIIENSDARLTIDTEVKFYRLTNGLITKIPNSINDSTIILELKLPIGCTLKKVKIPFEPTVFSKYKNAIQNL